MRDLEKLVTDGGMLIQRWRLAGKIATWLGAFLVAVVAYGAYGAGGGAFWMLAGLALAAGLAMGLGLWFSTFTAQWPIVRPFIDAERVRQRAKELES